MENENIKNTEIETEKLTVSNGEKQTETNSQKPDNCAPIAIKITDLTKKFKDRTAVDALNLEIYEGEFFALLGQNGAGKTTTIKMLSGLMAPTSGDAVLMGNSINADETKLKQLLNVSPQETAVAPNLSVKENLLFIAEIYGFKKADALSRAQEIMDALHLTDRAKDKAKTLSGGLQRRLSIAMALITDPKIVFLDEPTLGLDVRARRELWKFIAALKGKKTLILTTHYLEEADALADRIAVMHDGKLKALGTSAQLQQLTGKKSLEDAFLTLTDMEEYI